MHCRMENLILIRIAYTEIYFPISDDKNKLMIVKVFIWEKAMGYRHFLHMYMLVLQTDADGLQ